MRAFFASLFLLLVLVDPGFAQPRGVAGASVTTAISDDRVGRAVAASVGVQVRPRVRASFDIVHTPKLAPQFVHIVVTGTDDDAWTDATAFLGTLRVDIAPERRWSPFLVGGIGTARVTDVYYVVYVLPGPNPIRSSRLMTSLRGGVGVRLRLAERLALDLEGSWLGLSGDATPRSHGPSEVPFRHIGRWGSGVTYRF